MNAPVPAPAPTNEYFVQFDGDPDLYHAVAPGPDEAVQQILQRIQSPPGSCGFMWRVRITDGVTALLLGRPDARFDIREMPGPRTMAMTLKTGDPYLVIKAAMEGKLLLEHPETGEKIAPELSTESAVRTPAQLWAVEQMRYAALAWPGKALQFFEHWRRWWQCRRMETTPPTDTLRRER